MNMNKKKLTVREAALIVLEKVEKQQSYSNLILNDVIKHGVVQGKDVGLLTEIVYGTIQRRITLDYFLEPYLKRKPDSWVLNLLRLSLYQMLYLDKIPDRAVLYEAVEIAKRRGHKGISGFVNGVLRRVQREGVRSLDSISNPVEKLAIETSHPFWLVERWVNHFGFEKTKEMCEENLLTPTQTVRVNLLKVTRDEAIQLLQEEGIECFPSSLLNESIKIKKGNAANTNVYKEGLISVQDESSMIVNYALELEPNLHVLDACAAPGGKTGHIGERLQNTGKVIALDLHPHKVKLIEANRDRLGLQNVEAKVLDSRKVNDVFEKETFDRILVDAPCSGLGVLKKKPDIKYTKTLEDIYSLMNVQQEILHETSKLLKKDGILVYSTCTVDYDENILTVKKFLDEHPEFEPHPLSLPETMESIVEKGSHMIQIFPQDFGGDGFFIAALKKVK